VGHRPGRNPAGHSVLASLRSREWRNRQTRTVQVRVSERTWGFNSPLAHFRFAGQPRRLTPLAITMTDSTIADTDSVAISIFARCDSGMVSVGLKAEELVTDT
jgi:hypothetical protein